LFQLLFQCVLLIYCPYSSLFFNEKNHNVILEIFMVAINFNASNFRHFYN